jgi:hypothetical protein
MHMILVMLAEFASVKMLCAQRDSDCRDSSKLNRVGFIDMHRSARCETRANKEEGALPFL